MSAWYVYQPMHSEKDTNRPDEVSTGEGEERQAGTHQVFKTRVLSLELALHETALFTQLPGPWALQASVFLLFRPPTQRNPAGLIPYSLMGGFMAHAEGRWGRIS